MIQRSSENPAIILDLVSEAEHASTYDNPSHNSLAYALRSDINQIDLMLLTWHIHIQHSNHYRAIV